MVVAVCGKTEQCSTMCTCHVCLVLLLTRVTKSSPFLFYLSLKRPLFVFLSGTQGEQQRFGWMSTKTFTTPPSPRREMSPTESKCPANPNP